MRDSEFELLCRQLPEITGVNGTSKESEIDGTSIAISILVTFIVTVAAVAFLSTALGLVLHTYINKKRKEKADLIGRLISQSCEGKTSL